MCDIKKLCISPQLLYSLLNEILKWGLKVKSSRSVVCQLFATPLTVTYQAPLFMGFSRQEYWGGLLFPSPGDLPDPGIKPGSPALQTDALPSKLPGKPKIGTRPYNFFIIWFSISPGAKVFNKYLSLYKIVRVTVILNPLTFITSCS